MNDSSLGTKKKMSDDMHVMWRVRYAPGTLRAISRKNGNIVLEKVIKTAGEPSKIKLTADRNEIHANGIDLSFITVEVSDKYGIPVPDANNLVNLKVTGCGFITGVDNGFQASLEAFKANYRKAFNGRCLVIIQSDGKPGNLLLEASSDGLEKSSIELIAE
ncbi:Beta-galactosidase BoGH2A [subsurface metagenome]